MRVALVILHADPSRGGAERYTADLAAALARRGHDVTLVASTVATDLPAGVRPVLVAASGATRARRYARFLDALDARLAGAAYDVVHAMLPVRACDVYHPHAGVAAEQAARANALFNPRRRLMARVERDLVNGPRPPTVICLSEYVGRNVRRCYPAARTAALFNAVDLARFDPAAHPAAGADTRARFNLSSDDVAALMVAQDFARKGLREAIAALAVEPDERVKLLVVGRDSSGPYERLARRLGVAGRVRFAGPIADPYAFYAAAHFFVLPTRHDPCSLVVLEALAMGVPVVSTAFNGATEVMADGVHGFVLPDPADVPALAAAMRSLADRATRDRMSAACLALRPALSYDAHVDKLLAIYAGLRRT